MTINLERIKQLTLNKIEKAEDRSMSFPKKILLIAAVVTISSILMLGAVKLFDWKVMVNGKVQQGNYGDTIIVGDGFIAMSPEKTEESDRQAIVINFPDKDPDRAASKGELSLFVAQSKDKSVQSGSYGVCADNSLDFRHIKLLAENAVAKIHWPEMVTDKYKITENYTQFYTTQKQLKDAKLLYSDFGEWKSQQVFALPEGYEKNIDSMFLKMENPDGDPVEFFSHISQSDSQVYGGSGNAIIEELKLDGYKSVTFVSDGGRNEIHAWRSIPKIKSVDPLAFGEDNRPKDSLFSKHRENTVYQWQQYSFASTTLSKDELMEMLKSIELAK